MRPFRGAAALGLALVATVVAAPPAAAHTVTGVQPTNFKSRIVAISPQMAGITVRLLDLGNRVQLVNRTGTDVVVSGYDGEPYLRVGPRGVFENMRSPAVYLNRATTGPTTSTTLPRAANASAPPEWHRSGGGDEVRWRDRRTRWEAATPKGIGAGDVVSSWTIGLRQGERPISVAGHIVWVPGPSPVPWLLLAVALLGLTAGLAFLRRWGAPLSAALAVLVAVDVVHSFGVAAATRDAIPAQAARVVLGGFIGTLAWILGAFAIGRLQRESEGGLVGAGLAGILLALFGGFGDLTALARSQVPYAFPAMTARAAVAVDLGVGLGLAAAVALVIRRHPDQTGSPRQHLLRWAEG
jgi:hypothetical protein